MGGAHEVPHSTNRTSVEGFFNYEVYSWRENKPKLIYDESGLAVGGEGFLTFIHEIGHALGLAHPHDTDGKPTRFPGIERDDPVDLGDNNLNQDVYTVMSYNFFEQPLNSSWGYVSGPSAFDIAAIQYL